MKPNAVAVASLLATLIWATPFSAAAADAGCTVLGNDLKMEVCAQYRGVPYRLPLDFVAGNNGAYLWKTHAASLTKLPAASSACLNVADDLALQFTCVAHQGVSYQATLNFVSQAAEPTALYWKLDPASLMPLSGVAPQPFVLEKTIALDALQSHLKEFERIALKYPGEYRAAAQGHQETVQYIKNKLADSGLIVSEETVQYGGSTQLNLFAETASGDANQLIIVGAHLDSVSAGPGINDDGSGAATVLELALQVAKNKDFKPVNKLKFAWWAFEEPGMIGSTYHVNRLSEAEKAKIAMYLNLDMIATAAPDYYYGVEDGDLAVSASDPKVPAAYLEVFKDPAYLAKCKAIKSALVSYFTAYPVPKNEIVSSALHGDEDWEAFLLNRIPFGGLYSGKDKCNHQACDTYANLNMDLLLINAKAIASVMQKFAEKKELYGGL